MTWLVADNEAARLNALRDMRLLDTPPSESFDRLTRMASKLLGAPVSTISLTDGDRQWFKSKVGVDLSEIPREQAPCSYAIREDAVFVVRDLLADPRFDTSPLAEAGIRFYAGAPLITRAGFGLGTICVVDDKPRSIGPDEERILRDLAGLVMAQIDIQNMIGRVDATTGQANEHQMFEDLDSAAAETPDESRVGLLVDLMSAEQASHALRVLGGAHAEQVVREATDRLRRQTGNAVRLYVVGPGRCLLVWDESTARDAETLQEDVRHVLGASIACNGIPVALDAAMGLYRFRLQPGIGRQVLRCLVNALDDARRSKSPVALYSEAQDKVHARSFSILSDVPRALARADEFTLAYQPRIALGSGRCVGAEALLRWTHPTLGPLSPAEFVPLIERTAMVGELTDWVLRDALRQVLAWRAAGLAPPSISVNASPRNLEDPDFVPGIARLLAKTGLAADSLEIEVTESALADNAALSAQLGALRALGVAVAIDDFGSGYSNLSYLRQLPASVLKIDRAFTARLDSEERDRRLVRGMIGMAHDLGFRVVAEGVETQAAYDMLRDWGCEEAQGFLMAKPMPAVPFAAWMAAHRAEPAAVAI